VIGVTSHISSNNSDKQEEETNTNKQEEKETDQNNRRESECVENRETESTVISVTSCGSSNNKKMLNILYPQQSDRTLPAVLDSCTFYFCLA
jgi:hypothetical protein